MLFGLSVGAYRAMGLPVLSIKNLVKFHFIALDPKSPGKEAFKN